MRSAFKILAEGGKPTPGYHKIQFHMMFDIKMEYFSHKVRLVAGGHVTELPDTIMFASMVSRYNVFISLTGVGLYFLQVRKADIQNSYIKAPVA